MRAQMMLEKPDDVEVTLKITMSAGEWRRLEDQLPVEHPSWKLSSVIRSLLMRVREVTHGDDFNLFPLDSEHE